MKKKLNKIAILASGNGTTLEAIITAIKEKKLNASIKVVITDNKNAYAIKRAQRANIKTYILNNNYNEKELYQELEKNDINLVVLAGYLKLIPKNIIKKYTIINTHPSLLPKYGGKGMYGMKVHKAVVNNHEQETGATIHFVNEEYDKGKIIAQTKVKINPTDTPEDVSKNVQAKEKTQLIRILKDFSNGKIDI